MVSREHCLWLITHYLCAALVIGCMLSAGAVSFFSPDNREIIASLLLLMVFFALLERPLSRFMLEKRQ